MAKTSILSAIGVHAWPHGSLGFRLNFAVMTAIFERTEAAVRILMLFIEQKARPGHFLTDHVKRFADGAVPLADFKAGCDQLIKLGFIKKTEQDAVVLTKEGFSASLAYR